MKATQKIALWGLLALLVVGGLGVATRHHSAQATRPRLVATTFAIVQIADQLHLPLVGVPTTANPMPARYKSVTRVGSPMNPSVEKITALKPTAVYSVTTLNDQFGKAFKAQHVAPHFLNLTSVAHLEATLTQLGQQYHRETEAQAAIQKITRAKAQAQKRAVGQRPVRVLVLMGLPGASYMVGTSTSYVGDLVRLAGGTNVFADRQQEYLQPNDEAIQKAHPQVILRLAHAMPTMVTQQFKDDFKQNPMWAQTPAVKNHRVYDLTEPTFDATANMQADHAIRQVSLWLYPQAGDQHE